jgi:aminopeptidase N
MKAKESLLLICCLLFTHLVKAQLMSNNNVFTRADTLRGTITEYRKGWDVIKYELTVQPDIVTKTIVGKNTITYREDLPVTIMQIDLQQPLVVDSIVGTGNHRYSFKRDNNVCYVYLRDTLAKYKFAPGMRGLTVYYHGTPREAKRAPWDGGLVWQTDAANNPLIATACQGLGASAWWPCKDHQSDKPDSGMIIHIIAPDTLTAVSNGRLRHVSAPAHGVKEWTWEVKSPINSYAATMNIGKYSSWSDTLMGEAGKLDLEYWVLNYNLEKAKRQFTQVKPMLRSHEYWFGKYPFYEDSYKLIETPFLGMEHQSGVAYGNKYENGYLGRDLSGTGWGLKWDFIIIHESGHEWFGNNVTTNDIADMWVHEGFTNYSETLYTESIFGKQAAAEYNYGTRRNIRNDKNIIGFYGVNKEGSGDMYYKGGNLLNMLRQTINDDTTFRNILRGLNARFYHQTVSTKQVEDYISKQSSRDFSKVFDQYLRTTQIPVLEYYLPKNNRKIFFRWTNCVAGFSLPLVISTEEENLTITPTQNWKQATISKKFALDRLPESIGKKYYITVKQVKNMAPSSHPGKS